MCFNESIVREGSGLVVKLSENRFGIEHCSSVAMSCVEWIVDLV